jgi:hypothetical protein
LSVAYSAVLLFSLQPAMIRSFHLSSAASANDSATASAAWRWKLCLSLYWCFVLCGWLCFLVVRSVDPGQVVSRGPCGNAEGIASNPIVRDASQGHRDAYERLLRTGHYDTATYPDGAICVTCCIMRAPRTHHCMRCGVCVAGFDHCCPWTGGCITSNNHLPFVGFLVGAAGTCCLWSILLVVFTGVVASESGVASFVSHTWAAPIRMAVLSFPALFALFVCALLLQHAQLISRGMTTNEALHWKRYEYLKGSRREFRNPFHRGSTSANCLYFFKSGYAQLVTQAETAVHGAAMVSLISFLRCNFKLAGRVGKIAGVARSRHGAGVRAPDPNASDDGHWHVV